MSRIQELRCGSSHRNNRFDLHTKSLSSISFSLRQYSLLSVVITPTLDSEAKIFLAFTLIGNGVGCHLEKNPLQKMRSVSVLKIRELDDAQKSTIFSSLYNSSYVRLNDGKLRSLITKGLVLAPNTPPLLTPRQYILPLSSSNRINLSMAANFFIFAWRLLRSCSTSALGCGTSETLGQFNNALSPSPQVQKWP